MARRQRRKKGKVCCKRHDEHEVFCLPYSASKPDVERVAHIANKAIFEELFDHEIDIGEIVFKLKSQGYPYCGHFLPFSEIGNKDDLSVRKNFETKKLFVETVIHELVHKYLWDTFDDYSHGKRFKKCARVIKQEFGLVL